MLPGIASAGSFVENRIKVTEALARSGLLALASSGIAYDFGDSGCYAGSGETITDLLGTVNANRGASSTPSEGDEPAFNGTAGGLSKYEFFSFDGGDKLRAASQPAAAHTLHKAGAVFTVLSALYLSSASGNRGIFGTLASGGSGTSSIGTRWRVNSARQILLQVSNGGGVSFALSQSSSQAIPSDQWALAGVSFDNSLGSENVKYCVNGTHDSDSGTLSSPSASNASFTLELGAEGNASGQLLNGERLGFLVILFGAAASAEQFDRFFALMTPRYKI